MRKQLLASVSLLALLTSTQALGDHIMARSDNMILTFGADGVFEWGYRSQSASKTRRNLLDSTTKAPVGVPIRVGPSANNSDHAFNSSANAFIGAKSKPKDGLHYGVQIGLFASTRGGFPSQDHWGRTYAWFENDSWGRVELGTKRGASISMNIDADEVAAGSGGILGTWDDYLSLDTFTASSNYADPEMIGDNFATDNRLILKDSDGRANNEGSRKITFYTPTYNGFRVGVSYIPDESNRGGNSAPNALFNESGSDRSLRNAIVGGVTYEKQIDKVQKFKAAIVGETGQTIRSPQDIAAGRYFVKRPSGFDIGAFYEYDRFSVAGSYGNRGRFRFHLQPGLKRSHFFTAGLGYKCTDKIKTSITYYHSDNRNTLDLVSVGVSYSWLSGIQPYAEVTHVMAHQRFNYAPTKPTSTKTSASGKTNFKNRGTVAILGMRIEL